MLLNNGNGSRGAHPSAPQSGPAQALEQLTCVPAGAKGKGMGLKGHGGEAWPCTLALLVWAFEARELPKAEPFSNVFILEDQKLISSSA